MSGILGAAGQVAPASVTSVLIVSWNTCEHLRRCLASLRAASEADDLEVIVVDNASQDGSAEMVREEFPGARLILNDRNVGFTSATNQAFEVAQGDPVLMLNSDTVVPSGTITGCRELLFSRADVGAVGCAMRYPDGSYQVSCFRFPSLFGLVLTTVGLSQRFPESRLLNWDRYGRSRWSEAVAVDVVMGSLLMVRRDALSRAALLDDGFFMYAEETDLCRRLAAAGRRVLFDPTEEVVHVQGASTKTPEQLAWSDEAKKRGVLRWFRIWRGPMVAYIANAIMLLGLFPRALAWAVADLRAARSSGVVRPRRLLKTKALAFHLRALKEPRAMDHRWEAPA